MGNQHTTEQDWLPVIGRALAHLCMSGADMTNQTIVQKARFLEGLGIERKDAANMLGTTAASITEMIRQAKQKKGAKRGTAKKQKR